MLRDLYFSFRRFFRIWEYFLRNVRLGRKVYIEPRVFLSNTVIGDYSYIGHNSVIDKAEIGNYCSIAAFVQIGGMEHSHWWWSTSPRLSSFGIKNKTIIGHDVWIGSKVSLREGIRIGNGAVIGSNSVVLKDVEPYTIVAGVPAKVIRKRFDNEMIEALVKTEYYKSHPKEAKLKLDELDQKFRLKEN
ncbi:CatB-related O-acetyltransferase [Echinicola marina]|uniref:CatB-related O-acetyltransferase n=1 Tax=Echinicola marina TaxID=2859768 RepID=UPI001CF612AD|nr:CatB-related O-acetyltransferase [Echinicola marina]UCS93238.1 CatB-related O-acetyltransferase [Echinicola marina]